MEIAEHVEHMAEETRRVVDRLDVTGLDAIVPSCPGWTIRDLADHLGQAHRWAAAVIERRAQSRSDVNPIEARGELPPDDAFGAWLLDGQRHLAEVIEATPASEDFWRFMRDSPSSLAFWARRQAHETAIHRVDAELAGEAIAPAPLDPGFASDGIDELVLGFAPRYKPSGVPPTVLHFGAPDIDRSWTVAIEDGAIRATAGAPEAADLRVDAPASDLYLLLWNRATPALVALHGDAGALDVWRAAVAV